MSRWSQVIGGHLKPQSELPVVTFDDISGHWAKEMFEELASQGMITGYPDGSFHPNESIKRQHMALLLMRAFEIEPVREAVSRDKNIVPFKVAIIAASLFYGTKILSKVEDKILVPLPKRTRTLCHFGLGSYLNSIMMEVRWRYKSHISIILIEIP
ncbi:S-layer homology domain-containing protein [Paenibacillus marchantiae]|uniref:S-layer homology domain-containing protein n=1 Tax=Paenibacillus TaxID=44249 RepID=UPI000887BB20|nr:MULTISPECIES: S-layer homology domain-containing protein [Paenibacillus]WDQ31030.1 S-layer homology domain-containing protein [Paenibacillus marchantiae]SDK42278.1 S-layer homology domain-containing protein [Paenibacillus sp. OK060]SEA62554.1 S-layer homology domain-containing protein [Paenibacillus sp. 276b]